MTASQRLVALLCYCGVIAAVWFGPGLLGFDDVAQTNVGGLAQLVAPLIATIICYVAARHTTAGTRVAWLCMAGSAGLYLGANLAFAVFVVEGGEVPFPAPPDILYIAVSLAFALGLYHYGRDRKRVDPTVGYNFTTTYLGVMISGLLVLGPHLVNSALSPMGDLVAALYPSLWFAVAALGLVLFLLDDQGRRSPVFALLLLAAVSEGLGDYGYVLGLLSGSHDVGGAKQILWISASVLLGWAALEQVIRVRRQRAGQPGKRAPQLIRIGSQAAIPGTVVMLLLVSTQMDGVVESGLHVWLLGVLAAVFAVVQNKLRVAMETNRTGLLRTQDQLTAVLESTSDSVLVVDKDWRVVYFNHKAVDTIRKGDQLRLGVLLWELFPAALSSGEADHYFKAVESRQPQVFEIFVEDRQIWLGIAAYPTSEGLSIFFRDISEQKRVRDEVLHLAHHDGLTGLANRAVFQRQLGDAIASGEFVATLLLDLDHFKEVNDTLGHPVGDGLLAALAQRLALALGPSDTIARLGGDEFGIVLRGLEGRDEVAIVAEKVLATTNAPQMIEGRSIRIGGSLGIAVRETADDTPEMLFKQADIALYAAKSGERGGFRFYDPAMAAGLDERHALRADLPIAYERGEFSLVYQPQIALGAERITRFEALMRWKHPRLGMVPPSTFIGLAEETGFIVELGEWALRVACREAMRWPGDIGVAVNLSPRQFSDGGLAERVAAVLAETGLAPERLELEITETVLMRDSMANLETLRALRALGVRIALDDFGTGYSSLAYLQRFAFSTIKIDRSFVAGLPQDAGSAAIVNAMIGLGHSLGMQVTAEGVETRAQLEWLAQSCDEAQGYLLSRPLPAAEVAGLIARYENRGALRRAG